MQIREAQLTDCAGLAKVQVDSYQTAYRGFLPDEFLDQFTYDEQTQDWIDLLSDDKHDPLFVAVDAQGAVLGYALGRLLVDQAYDCELQAVHVMKVHQRQGIGTALIASIARQFADEGCSSLLLWTLKGNPASVMYEKLGGERIDEKTGIWDDGTQVTEVCYSWRDIKELIKTTS